jgi:ATP-dependent Clp protease ATP-binding subunit ClpA
MFERYTDPAKRAVYYAHVFAVVSERPEITTVDLLCGLLYGSDSRAHVIFPLREHFPLYNGCPCKFAKMPENPLPRQLTEESKQVLAWAGVEANELRDYWLDTEHLLLGVLRVRQCDAAIYLMRTGLTLKTARKTIRQNKLSRPSYGPVSRWWWIKNRLLYPI